MKYFINIPDELEKKQLALETFCHENKIPLYLDKVNFIGKGFTTQELVEKMEAFFDGDNEHIDKEKISKYFNLKRIAKELIFQLEKVMNEQFMNNFLPVANSCIIIKLEDYTRRARNMQELIDRKEELKFSRSEFTLNFMERSDGIEPVHDAMLFVQTDTSMFTVAMSVSTVASHILHIMDFSDFYGIKQIINVQITVLKKFERSVNISLISDAEKQMLLDSCMMPFPKEKGKMRTVKGSFKAILSFFTDMASFIHGYEISDMLDDDLLSMQNKAYYLTLDYGKRFNNIPPFVKAEKKVRETVISLIRTDERLASALNQYGYGSDIS